MNQQHNSIVVRHPGIGNIFLSDSVAAFAAADVYHSVYTAYYLEHNDFMANMQKGWGWAIEAVLSGNNEDGPFEHQGCFCTEEMVCGNCIAHNNQITAYRELCHTIAASLNIDPMVWNFLNRPGRVFARMLDQDNFILGVEHV